MNRDLFKAKRKSWKELPKEDGGLKDIYLMMECQNRNIILLAG